MGEARNPTSDSWSTAEQKYQAAPIFYADDAPLAISVIQPSECCLAEVIVLGHDAAVILPEHLHCIWTLPEKVQIIRLQSCAAWVGKGTEGLRVFQLSQVWAVREV